MRLRGRARNRGRQLAGWGLAGAAAGTPFATYSGLVSAWPLNEVSGNAIDAVGSNDLAPTGSPGTAAGKVGTARTFDGNTTGFSVATNAGLEVGLGDFWVAAWVYLTTVAGYQTFVWKGGGDVVGGWQLYAGNNLANLYIRNAAGDSLATTALTTTGAWKFLLAWRDTANATVNVRVDDGVPGSSPIVAAFAAEFQDFRLGRPPGLGSTTNGRLDAVAFGKPPGPIADVIDDIHAYLWNGGAGTEGPYT